MNRPIRDPNAFDLEGFIAIERELVVEPQEMRSRVLERARSSLQHHAALPFDVLSPNPRRMRFGLAAAAVVLLTALCAVAYVAGYQTRSRSAEVPPALGALAPTIVTQRGPVPSVVVALIPVPASANPQVPNSTPASQSPRVVQTKPSGSATLVTRSEAYSLELRVLQPARQAVARHDFASALATVEEHQRLYPSGVLSEEREALRVKALVGLGRIAEAKRAGAAFRKHFPRSALLGRIDEMLGAQQ